MIFDSFFQSKIRKNGIRSPYMKNENPSRPMDKGFPAKDMVMRSIIDAT